MREARGALAAKAPLAGKADELGTITEDVERALVDQDLARVRRQLPALELLVDELIERATKSTTRDYVESMGAAILIALCLRACVIEAFKIPSSSMYPTLEIGDHIFVSKFVYGVRIPWTTTKIFEASPARGEVIVFMMPCDPDRDYIKRVVAVAGDTVEVRCNVVHINGTAVPNRLVLGEGCTYDDHDEVTRTWFPRECSRYTETVGDLAYDTFHDADRPQRDARLAGGGLLDADDRDFPRLDGVKLPPSCATNPDGEPLKAPNQKPGKLGQTRGSGEGAPGDERRSACEPQLHYVVPDHHVFVMGDNRSNSNDSRVWGSVPIENIKGKALFMWLSYSHWAPTDWSGIRLHRIGNFVH